MSEWKKGKKVQQSSDFVRLHCNSNIRSLLCYGQITHNWNAPLFSNDSQEMATTKTTTITNATAEKKVKTKQRESKCNDLIFHWYFERISLCLFIILETLSFHLAFVFKFYTAKEEEMKNNNNKNNNNEYKNETNETRRGKKSSSTKQRINR